MNPGLSAEKVVSELHTEPLETGEAAAVCLGNAYSVHRVSPTPKHNQIDFSREISLEQFDHECKKQAKHSGVEHYFKSHLRKSRGSVRKPVSTG